MGKLASSLFQLKYIEELSRRKIWINEINPLIKLLLTLGFVVSVSSIGKYDIQAVLLYFVYPVFIFSAVELPIKPIAHKMILPVVMGASLGVLNPVFDQNYMVLLGQPLSAGWLSLGVLFLKSLLCILFAMILIATTTIEDIAWALVKLKLPQIVAVQFLLMFRYISLLVSEIETSIIAYSLRSGGQRALTHDAWGSFLGQLIMRTADKSKTLYEAMQLRGFDGTLQRGSKTRFSGVDGLYFLCWTSVLMALYIMR